MGATDPRTNLDLNKRDLTNTSWAEEEPCRAVLPVFPSSAGVPEDPEHQRPWTREWRGCSPSGTRDRSQRGDRDHWWTPRRAPWGGDPYRVSRTRSRGHGRTPAGGGDVLGSSIRPARDVSKGPAGGSRAPDRKTRTPGEQGKCTGPKPGLERYKSPHIPRGVCKPAKTNGLTNIWHRRHLDDFVAGCGHT